MTLPTMSQIGVPAVIFGGAGLLSLALTPAVGRVAVALGAIDFPGHRKIHTQPVPRLGGMAVVLAVAIVVGAALWGSPTLRSTLLSAPGAARWAVLAVAVVAIFIMGAIDDVRAVTARPKFVIELAAAAAVVAVAGTPRAIDLSPFAGSVNLGIAGPALGVLWIVALTNAVNMTDVVDGVAGGLSAIAAGTLALISLALGNVVAATVLLALSGALAGFLPHNFRSARIFLGDSGSLGVGFLLGSASLVGLERDGTWLALPALLALALPVTECSLTVLRRTLRAMAVVRADGPRERFLLRRGDPKLFTADRRHIPHRLLDLGMRPRTAIAVLYGVAAALGALAYATVRWPWLGPLGGAVAVAGLVWFAPRWLYDELRVFQRGAFLPLFESRAAHSRTIHAVYDAVAVAMCYLASQALVHGPARIVAEGALLWDRTAAVSGAALVGFWLAGLYRDSYRHAGISEALRASRAVLFGVVLGAAVHVVGFGVPAHLGVWTLHLYLVLTAVLGARLSFRLLDHMHQRGRQGGRRALIFGAGRAGEMVLREILSNPELQLVPIGFVDDDPQIWHRQFHGYPVHEAGNRLEGELRTLGVDELIVSTDKLDSSRLAAVVDVCRTTGVRLVHFGLRWDDLSGDGSERPHTGAAQGWRNATESGA